MSKRKSTLKKPITGSFSKPFPFKANTLLSYYNEAEISPHSTPPHNPILTIVNNKVKI